ncbi:MAG: MFS transporter [Desulfatiglandaceae bacterium]
MTQTPYCRPNLNPGAAPRRWAVFNLSASLFVISQFYRVSNAIIAPELQHDLDLSAESLGFLSAMFFYAFAAAQIPLALFLDRLGSRLTMSALSLVGAAGAFIFAFSETLALAVVGRALLGLGMAANLMGSMKLFTRWFSSREFATVSGILFALGALGNMLAATPLAFLVEAVGWRMAFALIGILTIVCSVGFFIFVRDTPFSEGTETSLEADAGSISRNLKLLLSRREYWLISIGTFIRYGVFVAIQGLWAGPYLIYGIGLSAVETGNFLLVLNIGFLIGSPVSGWLADRALGSPRIVALLGLAVMGAVMLLLSSGWVDMHLWLLGACFFMLGAFSAFGFMMLAHIKGVMPTAMTGMAITGVNLFTMLGAALYMQIMGKILDVLGSVDQFSAADFHRVFFVAFVSLAFAFFVYLPTRDKGDEAVQ